MRDLSLGKDSEKDTGVGVVVSVETLDARGGGGSDGPSAEDASGCWASARTGEAVVCVVFEQQPRLEGRQLVQCLLALTQTQFLHLPPALQRQHCGAIICTLYHSNMYMHSNKCYSLLYTPVA